MEEVGDGGLGCEGEEMDCAGWHGGDGMWESREIRNGDKLVKMQRKLVSND